MTPDKNRIVAFVWQHILLLISLFFLAFGVALCVRSNLGNTSSRHVYGLARYIHARNYDSETL